MFEDGVQDNASNAESLASTIPPPIEQSSRPQVMSDRQAENDARYQEVLRRLTIARDDETQMQNDHDGYEQQDHGDSLQAPAPFTPLPGVAVPTPTTPTPVRESAAPPYV